MESRKRLISILLTVCLLALVLSPLQTAQGATTPKSLQRTPIPPDPGDAWWNANWQYRKQHLILGSTAGAQTDYPILITVYRAEGTDNANEVYVGTKCQPDFDDIRFTTDGLSPYELDYWIEDENYNGNAALIWVEVPSIPASPDTCAIYMYYGNAQASGVSSGDDTFIFFDDFEDDVVDSSKWLEHNMDPGASFIESGGKLRLIDTTTEDDPWCVYQGLMARSGGADWNPPENSFKITLDNVLWNSTNPNVNLPQGNWGVSLSGSKNAGDLAAGDLSLFLNDAWIASKGRIHSSEDDEEHGFNSDFVPHQATCDFFIYKNHDDTVDTFYNQTQALGDQAQTNALNYLVIVYSGHAFLNYQELTIETFTFKKWVDPEPSHTTWGAEETDFTPPAWSPVPTDQVCEFGIPFSYDLNATDAYGLDEWWLNDTTHFKVNPSGLIQNATRLSVGSYGLRVWVNDTNNNIQTAAFAVTVQDSMAPTWSTASSDQVAEFGTAFIHNVSAIDLSGIHHYWINDTGHFAVDVNGRITSIGSLPVAAYGLEARAYDPYDNYCSATFTVKVRDTTSPTWIVAPSDQLLPYGQPLDLLFAATDLSGIDHWTVNDTVHFAINSLGRLTSTAALAPGQYGLRVTVYDSYNNPLSTTITITVQAQTTTVTTPPIPGFPLPSIAAGLLLAALCAFLTKRRASKHREAGQ